METSPSPRPLSMKDRFSCAVAILESAGIENALEETDFLFKEVFKTKMWALKQKISAEENARLKEYLTRRKKREPLSRIMGTRGFWNFNSLKITPATLDPRADSETAITELLSLVPDRSSPLRILDLGTGSGCLLLAMLSEFNNASGTGVDVSEEAARTARENALTYGLSDRASFVRADWNDPGFNRLCEGPFDVIVSNPPYIPTDDIDFLDDEVKIYDPRTALDGGKDGLSAYRRIAAVAPGLLKGNGFLILETGAGQMEEIAKIVKGNGFYVRNTRPDLGGIPRILSSVKRNQTP